MAQDDEHLKLLSIFHYILAGLLAVFGCFPMIHLAVGLMMLLAPEILGDSGSGKSPPPFVGWMFVGVGGFMILMFWTLAVVAICAGRFIARRKRHTYCQVAAAALCLFMPLGTVLGVFTILVLQRPSVKRQFGLPV